MEKIEKKEKKEKIVVLLGGASSEREVSLKSGASVLQALENLGYDAISFDPSQRPLSELLSINPAKIFNSLHGDIGENGVIQGFLEAVGIPFTGSSHLACGLSMQKHLCKLIWQRYSLPVIKGASFKKTDTNIKGAILANFTLPVAIKPSNGGSSVGVSKVVSESELAPALEKAFLYDDVVVVEEWVIGEEYTIGIIPNEAGGLLTLPSIRITAHTSSGWYDYEAKYQTSGTSQATSYELDTLSSQDEKKIQALALQGFEAIGGENWGRIDLIKRGSDFFLLEANLSPGMTATSLVPKGSLHIGISFENLIKRILDDTKN